MDEVTNQPMRQSLETWLVLLLGLSVGLLALLALGAGGVVPSKSIRLPVPKLRPVSVDSAHALEKVFKKADYDWPPGSGPSVPRLAVTTLPEDLSSHAVVHKKSLFLRSLLPLILAENREILNERAFLTHYFSHRDFRARAWATRRARLIAKRFRVRGDLANRAVQAELMRRVDVVPPALALAQAAIESGWGTSRFALEGNSLFGQWTWDEAHGITPSARVAGARHAVRAFPSLRASVRAYFRNLNTFGAYAKFRYLRAAMRREGKPLNPMVLADGLGQYSQRGDDYVAEVKTMIQTNDLGEYVRGVRLAALAH